MVTFEDGRVLVVSPKDQAGFIKAVTHNSHTQEKKYGNLS